MNKKSIILILTVVMIFASIGPIYAEKRVTSMEDGVVVTNIFEDEKSGDRLVEVSVKETITGANGPSMESKSVDGNEITRSGAAAISYANASLSSSGFLNRVSASATTRLEAAVSGGPVPQWTLYVSGVLYKNYRSFDRLASTEDSAVWSVSTANSDYYPKRGDYYELDSFHRVYDYNGTKIWDKQLSRDETF